jgi:drug/metabolite transporter (DMT)-like permease
MIFTQNLSVQRNAAFFHWLLFLALCIIWGSSFILMKEGMKSLNAYQVASIRILSAGIILLPVGLQQLKKIPYAKIKLVLLSALLGSFFPAFLFCIAETNIDSSLAAFLNAFTPILTIITGIMFFNNMFPAKRLPGVFIGLAGMLILFLAGGEFSKNQILYSSFVLAATLSYALNVNLVSRYLKEVGSLNIAAVGFTLLIVPTIGILFATGFFQFDFSSFSVLRSVGAASVLGIFGTAIGSVLFYVLLKSAGPLFASTVTYGVPFVALLWGLIAGETITMWQLLGLTVLLTGVYLTNK